MIRHHQGAKDMAGYAATNAAQPALATLARTMAETQAAEVETMTDMLAARGGIVLADTKFEFGTVTGPDGAPLVEEWTITGLGHGVPIDPHGPDGLGAAGPLAEDPPVMGGAGYRRVVSHRWTCSRPGR